MCSSDNIIPFAETRACSGKCKSGGCAKSPRVWIVAACEGMVSLFTKDASGRVAILDDSSYRVFATMEQFQQSLDHATHEKKFDQIVIVGSSNDIAWVHSALPACTAGHIAAEIKYPLLASWFKESAPMPHLSRALTTVLTN